MTFAHLAGHLGTDPETRVTPSGQKVTTLRVAVNIRRGGKDETVWWRVSMWGDRWDKMIPYLKKGSAVMVMGRMDKPEIYTDKEGRPQVSLNLTADNVEFPPFGRPDKPATATSYGQPSQEPDHHQGSAPYAGNQGYSTYTSPNTTASGQGSYQYNPSDADKLPF